MTVQTLTKMLIILAITLVMSIPILAEGPKISDSPWFRVHELEEKLNLNEDQVDQLININRRYRDRYFDNAEKMAPMKVQIRRLYMDETTDRSRLKALLEKQSDIHIDMMLLRLDHRQDVYAILTPEQKKRLNMIKREHFRKKRDSEHKKKRKYMPW